MLFWRYQTKQGLGKREIILFLAVKEGTPLNNLTNHKKTISIKK